MAVNFHLTVWSLLEPFGLGPRVLLCWAEKNFNILSISFSLNFVFLCHISLSSLPFLPLRRKLIIWVDRPLPLWALQVRQISTLLCKQGLSLLTHISAYTRMRTRVHAHSFLLVLWTMNFAPVYVHTQTPGCLLLHLNLLPLKRNHQHAYWFHPRSPLPSLRLLISLSALVSVCLTAASPPPPPSPFFAGVCGFHQLFRNDAARVSELQGEFHPNCPSEATCDACVARGRGGCLGGVVVHFALLGLFSLFCLLPPMPLFLLLRRFFRESRHRPFNGRLQEGPFCSCSRGEGRGGGGGGGDVRSLMYSTL